MPSRPLPLAARLKRPVKSALFILKEVSTVQKKKAVPICQQGSIIYCIGLHQVNCELGQIITCIILLRRGNMTRHRINHKEVSLAQHTPAGLEYVTSATTLSLPHPPFSLNTPNALHLQKQLFGVITRNGVCSQTVNCTRNAKLLHRLPQGAQQVCASSALAQEAHEKLSYG